MKFNFHKELEGRHAFISASKYHWMRYSDEKFSESFTTRLAATQGTRLHELAKELILLGQKLPRTNQTLNLYVNECISYRMEPEVVLSYSRYAFGTADAIRFDQKKKLLMISDLKTGVHEAHFEQLEVYTAFFCLEYGFRPSEIDVELRLYQNDAVRLYIPELNDIVNIMGKIVRFSNMIEKMQEESDIYV